VDWIEEVGRTEIPAERILIKGTNDAGYTFLGWALCGVKPYLQMLCAMVIKKRIFRLFTSSSSIRLITPVLLTALTACYLGACNPPRLQDDADLESSIRRLSQLLDEYYKIPTKKQNYGNSGFIVWKDQAQVTSFYERYRDEIRIMDNVFSMNAKTTGIWSDDAAFSRGVLYWLLTQLIPNSLTDESALAVWNDFIRLGSGIHIEEPTKIAMGDAFVNKQTGILTPTLSYEENLQVIFQGYTALLLVKMKQYEKAIKENELIMQTHPTSRYAKEYARDQIRAITSIMEEKIIPPDTLPER